MTPFRISCVTCSARLAVRSESLIGQIVACPKCNSMVLVEPPAGTPAAGAGESAAAGATPSVEAPTPAPTTVEAPTPPAAGFDDFASALSDEPLPGEPTAEPPPTEPATPSTVPAATEAGAGRSLMWIAGGATLGALLVAGVMLLVGGARDDSTAADVTLPTGAPEADAEPRPPSTESEVPATAAPPPVRDVDDGAVVADEGLPAAALDQAPAQVDPALTDQVVAESSDNPFLETAGTDADVADSSAGAPHDEIAADAAPAAADQPQMVIESPPRVELDPLTLDPEGLNLASLLGGPPPATPLDEPPAAVEPANDEADLDESRPPVADEAALRAVRRDPAGSPPGAPPDVTAALAVRWPAVDVKEMPLCRFVDFITNLSGTPVSVSPEQLQLAAANSRQAVSVALQDAPLEQVLTEALAPLRLEPQAAGDQIVLVRAKLPDRRTIEYPVSDLTDREISSATIAGWIKQFVAPESWAAADGGRIEVDRQSLAINAPESIQYEILLLLEGIRKARKLPLKSRYPAVLVAGESPYVALHDRLAAPAVFTFTRYTPLREIFRHWQEETELAVLVDWPELATQGLWPPTRVACSQHDVPWNEALDAVLEPLGLGWRAVDGRTIQITTAALAAEPATHIYRGEPHQFSAQTQAVGDGVYLLRGTPAEHRQAAQGR